ncbi:hypothetical protein FOZ63_019813, partial [Perkinsus olseni]
QAIRWDRSKNRQERVGHLVPASRHFTASDGIDRRRQNMDPDERGREHFREDPGEGELDPKDRSNLVSLRLTDEAFDGNADEWGSRWFPGETSDYEDWDGDAEAL